MDSLDGIIANHRGRASTLLVALQEIQESAGYIPEDAIRPLAAALGVTEGDIKGVISFYTELRTSPPGRHRVRVCTGDSCSALGSRHLARTVEEHGAVAPGGTSADGEFSFDTVYCLGNCALGPSVVVDGEVYGRVTPEGLARQMEEAANG